MKLGDGELVGEVDIAEIKFVEESFSFGEIGALAENPGDKLELGNVVFAVDVRIIDGVADEVETSDAEAFLVDSVIEERVVGGYIGVAGVSWIWRDVSDADHSVVRI